MIEQRRAEFLQEQKDKEDLVEEAVQAALDAGCLVIQKHFGQTDGGWAEMFFCSSPCETFMRAAFEKYFDTEKALKNSRG